jgi:hypothetical protein
VSRLLATAVPAAVWSEELAHRWWDRHHPEAAGIPLPPGDQRMLTKTMDIGWVPIETPTTTAS